jgi:hypothetical protein
MSQFREPRWPWEGAGRFPFTRRCTRRSCASPLWAAAFAATKLTQTGSWASGIGRVSGIANSTSSTASAPTAASAKNAMRVPK